MSTFKKLLHTIVAQIQNIFSHHELKLEDIGHVIQVLTIIKEVKTETAGISDGVALTNAIVKSVIKHAHELPDELKGEHLENTIVEVCQKILDLPLEEIQGIVKGELSK